jgi:hypothetical protein
MGFFDKFNPFKKNDGLGDLGLPPFEANAGLGAPPMGPNASMSPSMPTLGGEPAQNLTSGFNQPEPMNDHRMNMPMGESLKQNNVNDMHSYTPSPISQPKPEVNHNPLQKDLELISSKLDYLKASLEAINQRLANLEHLARQEQDKGKW